ncbi:TPA: sugar ABC transporter permease, partial [Streptococcus equi subsp. equi]|nr:sugar ABC transporter permease [Streptococcus equi subsp. equi]
MTTKISSKKSFWKNVIKYRALLLMVLPGFVWFIFFF